LKERIAAAMWGSPKIFRHGVPVGRLFLRAEHRGRNRIMISSLKEGENLGTDLE
jgi:hypothetical protein